MISPPRRIVTDFQHSFTHTLGCKLQVNNHKLEKALVLHHLRQACPVPTLNAACLPETPPAANLQLKVGGGGGVIVTESVSPAVCETMGAKLIRVTTLVS